jgi:hypothetical protein
VFPVLFLAALPTYHRDVEPILQNRCQVCHHPGAAGPFSLLTPEDARARAEDIKEAVTGGRMPPWHADPRYGKFANDRRLTEGEKSSLLSWIETGMIEGDKRDAPPAKTREEGWMIGKPDVILEMPVTQEIPASGVMDYQVFYTPIPWNSDKWITALEIRPGDKRVVHHAQFYLDSFHKLLASYDPGLGPLVLPPDTAIQIPAGHQLAWNMHYTPNGKATTDRTRIGIRFWKGESPPRHVRYTVDLVNKNIDIAPGDPAALVENSWTTTTDATVLSVFPHMHLRGKDFRLEVTYPDGRTEVPWWCRGTISTGRPATNSRNPSRRRRGPRFTSPRISTTRRRIGTTRTRVSACAGGSRAGTRCKPWYWIATTMRGTTSRESTCPTNTFR